MTERLSKIMFVFNRFGLTPSIYNGMDKKHIIILWLNILIVIFIGAYHVLYQNVYESIDPIGKFSDILETFLPLLVHIILLLEVFSKSCLIEKINSTVYDIEFLLEDLNSVSFGKTKRTFQELIRFKFLIYNFICISTEMFIMVTITYNTYWIGAWCTKIFSVIAVRLGDLTYIYYVDHLTFYSSMINFELERMLNVNTASILTSIKLEKKIIQLKYIDWKIWKLSNLINKRFRWFLVTNISNQIVYLIINCFWIYCTIYFKSNPAALRKIYVFCS